jgi:DNA-binding NarL/FixJ family response regulator
MKKILIIGRHPEMLASVIDMLNQNGYVASGETENEKAILAFKSINFDAVVIGGGVDHESRNYIHYEFPKINAAIKIIDGNPHTILEELKKIPWH